MAIAQVAVTGRVVNIFDKKPITGASIFISNTTIGSTTAEDGSFTLQNVKTGKYGLVITCMGYEPYTQNITIGTTGFNTPVIQLVAKATALHTVTVKAENAYARERNYDEFKKSFLGISPFAKSCTILNPEVINFEEDNSTGVLKASSDDFIIIDNQALGYRIRYLLKEFVKSGTDETIHYDGSVLFEKMKGSPAQQRQWQNARQRVYKGSAMHFLRAALENRMEEEGFRVFQYQIRNNPERPLQQLLQVKINRFNKLKAQYKPYKDSLTQWKKLARLPESIKTLQRFPLQQSEIIMRTDQPGLYALGCNMDGIYITYQEHRNFSSRYSVNNLDNVYNHQNTLLNFIAPYTYFDANGWVITPGNTFITGAWAANSIAYLLPVDYWPDDNTAVDALALKQEGFNKAIDTVLRQINLYGAQQKAATLFVHYDKTVYTPDENIWFKAYLLNQHTADTTSRKDDVLALSLVNNNSRRVVLSRQFLLQDDGAYGQLVVPDSVPPGRYSLVAYTNRLVSGKPEYTFVQPITIKTAEKSELKVDVSFPGLNAISGGAQAADITVFAPGQVPAKAARLRYWLSNTEGGTVSNTVRLDNEGKYRIRIPAGETGASYRTLEVEVVFNGQKQYLTAIISQKQAGQKQTEENLKFYPEGGNLVVNVPGWIGFEAKTEAGTPVKLNAVLYRNKQPVDTISTNSYGIGKFKLNPLANSEYEVKLLGQNNLGRTYALPAIQAAGPVLHLSQAVADDTLSIQLRARLPQTCYVVVHNFRQVFDAFEMQVKAGGRPVTINLKSLPKGLAAITILDNQLQPCAERLFFAHYNRRPQLSVVTDKQDYPKRGLVSLKLKSPVSGQVSIACVQLNRLPAQNHTDIESYLYLQQDLGRIPLTEDNLANTADSRQNLENLLLVKGWRRYNWQEMMKATPVSGPAAGAINYLFYSGAFTNYARPLSKPADLIIMGDSGLHPIKTDRTGKFTLVNRDVMASPNKKINLMAFHYDPATYKISVNNPYLTMDKQLAIALKIDSALQPVTLNNNSLSIAEGLKQPIALRQVNIRGKWNNEMFQKEVNSPAKNANECGDYVCKYGILNCMNHMRDPKNKPAIKYHSYFVLPGDLVATMYLGCDIAPKAQLYTVIEGIKYSKEFYGADYAKMNPPEPEYLSTVFWKHAVQLTADAETELKFYNSDITGPFKIVIQGIAGNDVVYRTVEIDVREK